jgi:hypothetical protein
MLIPIEIAHHSGMKSPGVRRPLLALIGPLLFGFWREWIGMPMGRLAMRYVREVMRLKAAGLSVREIGRRIGAVPSTVRLTIRRFEAAG